MTTEEMEQIQIAFRRELELTLKPLIEDVSDHSHFINGNGNEGAKTRIAKLEQNQGYFKWGIGAIATSVIGIVVAAIWELIRRS